MPWSLCEQYIMDQGPLCYTAKLMKIGPLVAKIFKAFYHIWVWKPYGHVTNIILTCFRFLVPKSLHTKFGKKCQVVSEKNKF